MAKRNKAIEQILDRQVKELARVQKELEKMDINDRAYNLVQERYATAVRLTRDTKIFLTQREEKLCVSEVIDNVVKITSLLLGIGCFLFESSDGFYRLDMSKNLFRGVVKLTANFRH